MTMFFDLAKPSLAINRQRRRTSDTHSSAAIRLDDRINRWSRQCICQCPTRRFEIQYFLPL